MCLDWSFTVSGLSKDSLLLSSASSVDSPVLVDYQVSGLAAYLAALLFSTQKLVFN
jgi:hypothetical protein